MNNLIARIFSQNIATQQRAAQLLPRQIVAAFLAMTDSLTAGGKVLACGNGGSAGDAQHFAAELVNRFETERRALAALALTTDGSNLTSIGNDRSFDDIFSRQIYALGTAADVLLAITTSGNSANVENAIVAARDLGMRVVLLSGGDGGRAAAALRKTDVEILAPSYSTARIQETHLVVLHALCAAIDQWCEE